MSVRRFDASVLGRVERTPQGGIKVPARVTRVGVFPYKMGDGTTRRELRPPEEVFAPESLSSLNDAPVTDLHPGEPVTPANWRTYSIGHVSTPAVRAGDFVETTLAVQDGSGISKIDNGERSEVSLGYQCEVEDAPGEWNGERYDAIQRSIRYNHVAIGPVGWGRAGRAVALRLDSADGFIIEEKEDATMKIKIGGKEYEIGSPEATKALADLEGKAARTDALEAEIKTAKRGKIVDAVRTLRARKGKRLDAAEEKAVESASDLDLMLMLLKTDPSFDAENTSEEYVRGCFAAYVKRAASETSTEEPAEEPLDSTTTDPVPAIVAAAPGSDGLDRALDSINAVRPRKVPPTSKSTPKSAADKTRTDAEDDAHDSDKARQRMIEDNRKAGTSALRLVRK